MTAFFTATWCIPDDVRKDFLLMHDGIRRVHATLSFCMHVT